MQSEKLFAFLFDVDGVIVDSPHEESWREAANEWNLINKNHNFHKFYQKYVAGMPGLTGAQNILENLDYYKKNKIKNVREKEEKAKEFRETKQKFFEKNITSGNIKIFEDIIAIINKSKGKIPIAAVSSSENSEKILRKLNLFDIFDSTTLGALKYKIKNKENLYAFAFGKLCGIKKIKSSVIPVVFEDADMGIASARKIGYVCVGIAREGLSTPKSLIKKGADLAYDTKTLLRGGYSMFMEDLSKLLKNRAI